jgi:hypothetical protein
MTKEQAKEEKSISELLDFAIHECMREKKYGIAEIILMHWDTYDKLCNDYKSRLSCSDTDDVNLINYKGIKIVRSLDIAKDEIKVY